MKITEAYRSRAAVEAACKSADACSCEYKALLSATTAVEWENVLLRNFSWCVKNCIMEEWLPAALPACVELYCYGCTGLTALPSEMPKLKTLWCTSCVNLREMPSALPSCVELICSYCPSLTALPAEMSSSAKILWN